MHAHRGRQAAAGCSSVYAGARAGGRNEDEKVKTKSLCPRNDGTDVRMHGCGVRRDNQMFRPRSKAASPGQASAKHVPGTKACVLCCTAHRTVYRLSSPSRGTVY
jgi:hypothetical protein